MDKYTQWLTELPVAQRALVLALAVLVMIGLAFLANLVAKYVILRVLRRFITRTKTKWDDILMEKRVFARLSHLAPALVIYLLSPHILVSFGRSIAIAQTAAGVYMLVVALLVIDAFLNAVVDIYRTFEFSHQLPIKGFVQVVKIILSFVGGIIALSIVLGKNPSALMAGMGAMTAILLLIFKDSILGFVAGIQLSTNKMIRLGDWIEMPKYGADGDVIDISLTTVKVQNWDKTIATIPTYALISDSFKNWRGMADCGGRRIKRSVNIDMTSIKFCTEEMIEKFRKFQYIAQYVDSKKKELAQFNADAKIDDSELVNGRRMTNIGTFRAYLVAYLRNHPKIHQDMTFLIRHLNPTDRGLPIEIYVFSNDQAWANYEAIQADIFDHILAVIPQFELRVFQNPTGADFQKM